MPFSFLVSHLTCNKMMYYEKEQMLATYPARSPILISNFTAKKKKKIKRKLRKRGYLPQET